MNTFNPIALRKDKIVFNFGLSECIRVNESFMNGYDCWELRTGWLLVRAESRNFNFSSRSGNCIFLQRQEKVRELWRVALKMFNIKKVRKSRGTLYFLDHNI